MSEDDGVAMVVECIEELLPHAAARGVILALENHYKDNYWTHPEFAQHLRVSAPSVTQTLQRLEREGYVRLRDLGDRKEILLTDSGKKIGEEFRELRQKIRSELTPDQRKKFADIMKQHDERDKRDDRSARPSPPAAGKPQ